jgi:GNAT superfamily N-acetyltransferase
MPFDVRVLTPDLLDAWADLFRACASGCFCRYWHFEGTKNEWLARLAFEPAINEADQRERLQARHPSATGLVALSSGVVVGWMKLTTQGALGKLRRLPVYRSELAAADEGVLGIGCVLVHPEHRRQGVARALLEGAVSHARATGAKAIEAYPHLRSEPLRDEELWMGPYALLEAAGFVSQGGNRAYPVMRLALPVASRH